MRISIFKNLFKKIEPGDVNIRPRAVAFVDFEHWYISLDKMYNRRPDIKGWFNEVSKKYDLGDIYFFADFSNNSLRQEIPKIREITSFVIDTQNVSSHHKKDYTDFIMLDHIYQKAMTASDIETFIVFSGDGHFSSVVSFLTVRLEKSVGIYGVKDAISGQLRNSATWTVEISGQDPIKVGYYKMILKNLLYLKEKSGGKEPRVTFKQTVLNVARLNKVKTSVIDASLKELIELGYIRQDTEVLEGGKKLKILLTDWNKIEKDFVLE